jgi:beta-1,4-mannosyltransferase
MLAARSKYKYWYDFISFDSHGFNSMNGMRVLAWPIDNGCNPYTIRVYENMGPHVEVEAWPGNLLKKYSVLHMHWPEGHLNVSSIALRAASRISAMFAALDYLRLRGTKIIWTMHNLDAHEAFHPSLERWFWRQFVPRIDGAISLSAAGLSLAMKRFPRLRDIPTTIIPHGHYREEYPSSAVDARKTLGIPQEARVFIFLGAVRAYKNVTALVRAFGRVTVPNALLFVAGVPSSSELAAEILKEASLDSRVQVQFEYVKVQDVCTYFGAANLVVIPYRKVLNSGSALLALSCNRPVLVPDLGAMSELQADYGDDWVQTYHGEIDETILEQGLRWADQPRPAVCPVPEQYSWQDIALKTVRFYESVVLGAPLVRNPLTSIHDA